MEHAARGSKAPLHRSRRAGAGFTLIELLVVVAIIAILAGLALSTLGYVNRKGAESRAQTEVAALSAAIESYKLEFGTYPLMDNVGSSSMTNQVTTTNLYLALSPSNTNAQNTRGRVFFEPTPSMVASNPMRFVDPWGADYLYRTNTNGNVLVNVGFFDVWSTAGNTALTNQPNWIRN
jgi:prepilin-type N-terminal cleavage/methylation domain-containing protein